MEVEVQNHQTLIPRVIVPAREVEVQVPTSPKRQNHQTLIPRVTVEVRDQYRVQKVQDRGRQPPQTWIVRRGVLKMILQEAVQAQVQEAQDPSQVVAAPQGLEVTAEEAQDPPQVVAAPQGLEVATKKAQDPPQVVAAPQGVEAGGGS